MLRKYVNAVAIGFLIVAWLAVSAYGFIYLGNVTQLAQAVARGTHTFRQELEEPRVELLAERGFPEGRVVDALRATWSEGVKPGSWPADAVAPAMAASESRRRRPP